MSISTEKRIEQQEIFKGNVLHVTLDTVTINDDRTATREVVWHPGASAVIPVLADGRVLLVRQYRYAVDQPLLEIPAGKLDNGEAPEICAKRELEEEAGIRCDTLIPLGSIYTSPGFSDEIIYLYLAKEMTETATDWDDDECMENEIYTPAEVFALIDEGKISDAKTIAAFFRARKYMK